MGQLLGLPIYKRAWQVWGQAPSFCLPPHWSKTDSLAPSWAPPDLFPLRIKDLGQHMSLWSLPWGPGLCISRLEWQDIEEGLFWPTLVVAWDLRHF